MKSKLRFTMLLVLIAGLMLASCGNQNNEAGFQDESSPVRLDSTEDSLQEDQGEFSSVTIDATEPPPQEDPSGAVIVGGPGTTSWDAFLIPLLDALTQTPPDYATLQSKMSQEFWILEPFAAMNFTPADAIAQFGSFALPTYAAVTYDLNIDPNSRTTFPLPTDMGELVYTIGWIDGSAMGALIITSTSEGYEWSGVYIGADKDPEPDPIRIEFAPGATSATVMGSLTANGIDEYILYALEGQTMTVTITSPGDNVYLSIYGMSDGIPLVRTAGDATAWSGVLPMSQDYSIKAVSTMAVPSYQMEVTISPLDTKMDWVPLPDGMCQDVEVSVAGTLGVTDIGLDTNAPFTDYINGTSGEGCLILVGGTGVDFPNLYDVYMQLSNMLATMGWTPDMQYDAGGPTGIGGGFRLDAGLMLVMVGWSPSSNANCPQDQPISACSLTPEQKIYTITLSVAMQ